MDPSEYVNMYRQETRHWWYAGMRDISMRLLEGVYGSRDDLLILDAGMGTGAMARALGRFGRVVGVDLSAQALQLATRTGPLEVGQANLLALPFPDETFDLLTSFDVLYHQAVPDVEWSLAEVSRVLKPDGRLLLRVPAYNWLRGHHDQVVHTARRFSASDVARLLTSCGLRIERLTYANAVLLPLALGRRVAERLFRADHTPRTDVTDPADTLNAVFGRVLRAEAQWLRSHNLPFGLSVFALGRKG